jgi:hypothetical protein
VAGSWHEPGADAFWHSWQSAGSKIEDLAADCERAASALEDAAGRLAPLRELMLSLVLEVEALIRALQGLPDPSLWAAASQHASGLVSKLQEVLRDIQSTLAGLSEMLLALTLMFEHLMRSVRPVELEPLPRPGIVGKPVLLPGRGIGIELGPLHETGVLPRPRLGGEGGVPWDPKDLLRWLLVAAMVAAGVQLPVITRWLQGHGGGSGGTDSGYTYYTYQQWQARMAANAGYFGSASAGSPPPSPPPQNKGNYFSFKWWMEQLRLRGVVQQQAQRLGVSAQRVEELAYDPDNGGLTNNSVNNEAPAAIQTERQGLDGLQVGDLQRAPNAGSGDYIGNGRTYDVKTPDSSSNFADQRGIDWLNEIQNDDIGRGRRIIFNIRSLSPQQVQQLQQEVTARGWSQQVAGYVSA